MVSSSYGISRRTESDERELDSEAEEENQEEVLWIDKYAPTNRVRALLSYLVFFNLKPTCVHKGRTRSSYS